MEERACHNPRLAGTTGALYQRSILESSRSHPSELENEIRPQHSARVGDESNYFKNAQWSPDGTTVITSSADNILRSFILPVDLLTPVPNPHPLLPYSSHCLPEPAYATAIHPSYDLSNPPSTLFITSLRALPVRLLSPFAPSILATYHLVSPTTEQYIIPHSLLFSPDNPHHFFAGSESMVSTFDINQNGQGPLNRVPTTPSRRNRGGVRSGEMGMKGIVSALGLSCEGLLAAGTFSRWIGLYDGYGRGGTTGIFEVKGNSATEVEDRDGGGGVTQVIWSACGRYLCVVERNSDGISVWDVRGTGRRLSWFHGRKALTNQRLGVDIIRNELWAGGTDGVVRAWEGLGMVEGNVDPTLEFRAHDDAVSATVLHPCGSVLATCSGQRHPFPGASQDECRSESGSDNDELSSSSSSDSLSSASSPSISASSPLVCKSDNTLNIWALE